MFDNIKNRLKKNLAKENTMKQNFLDFMIYCYTPTLMIIVYYIIPDGKQIMEKTVSYELWYILVILLMFTFTIKPLLTGIEQYRNRDKK